MTTSSLTAVTFDCQDALIVARFWAAVLGRDVAAGSTSEHAVLPPRGSGIPRLVFNSVPESKVVKNRLHIDVLSDEFSTEVVRIEDLGATRLADHVIGGLRWTTFADVEGNEFDLIADEYAG
jgi:hypothetical protein